MIEMYGGVVVFEDDIFMTNRLNRRYRMKRMKRKLKGQNEHNEENEENEAYLIFCIAFIWYACGLKASSAFLMEGFRLVGVAAIRFLRSTKLIFWSNSRAIHTFHAITSTAIRYQNSVTKA